VSLGPPLFTMFSLTMIIDENDDTLRFFIYEGNNPCAVSFICPRHMSTALEETDATRHVVAIGLHFSTYSVNYTGIQRYISSLNFLRSIFTSFEGCDLVFRILPKWRELLRRPDLNFQHACPRHAAGGPEESHTMPKHQDGVFFWELITFDGITASSTGSLNMLCALIYLKQPLGIAYQNYKDMIVEIFKNQGLCFKASHDILSEHIYDLPVRLLREKPVCVISIL
jgi:hypothetical protein